MSMYCTPAELRTQINKTGTTGDASDTALRIIIEGVSGAIDSFYNLRDGLLASPVASARVYAGDGKPYIYIDACVSISSVAVKDSATDSSYTSWSASDWIAFSGDPNNPEFNKLPYTAIMTSAGGTYDTFTGGQFTTIRGFRPSSGVGRAVPTVQVTARWGHDTEVPPIIKEATVALSARYFKQGQGAWADTLASPDFGQLIYQSENAEIRFMLQNARFYRPPIGAR